MASALVTGHLREHDRLAPPGVPGPAVSVRGLVTGYGRRAAVLDGVSLEFPAGKVTMIVGPSGSGKTTLLKAVTGLVHGRRGEVTLDGDPVRRSWRLNPAVAYIPQQLGLVRGRTALDNVLSGALARLPAWRVATGLFPGTLRDEARGLLVDVGIGTKAASRVRELSGGERQRVAIARALMQRPRVILADEFVSHLDPVTTDEVMTLVTGLVRRTAATLVITTHELELVDRYADRVVVLRDGRVAFDGPPAQAGPARLAELMHR
jgi:phosphonate transport system ATP-binding protein